MSNQTLSKSTPLHPLSFMGGFFMVMAFLLVGLAARDGVNLLLTPWPYLMFAIGVLCCLPYLIARYYWKKTINQSHAKQGFAEAYLKKFPDALDDLSGLTNDAE